MEFVREERPKVLADLGTLTSVDVGRELGRRWQCLSKEERIPFEIKNEENHVEYVRRKEAARSVHFTPDHGYNCITCKLSLLPGRKNLGRHKLMKHEGIKIVSSLLDSVLSGVLINIGNEGVVQGIWEEREESSWDDYLVQRD